MKLTKQEEVDKAAFNFSHKFLETKTMANILDNSFKAGVGYTEEEFSKLFPNGFDSWYETFYEVVCEFFYIDGQHLEYKYPLLEHTQETKGIGGLYELAKELTNKFELLHKDREWDGEFYNELSDFLEIELSK